jgi:uncharacterized protein DUF6602
VTEKVDLRGLLLGKQEILRSQLAASSVHWHPDAKGDVGEVNWHAALDGRHGREGFLPGRYAVSSAYVIDADGNRSDQIDLLVCDRHFSPVLIDVELCRDRKRAESHLRCAGSSSQVSAAVSHSW